MMASDDKLNIGERPTRLPGSLVVLQPHPVCQYGSAGVRFLKLPEKIKQLIREEALFVLSDSGGKDSQAMRILVRWHVPQNRRMVIHASLGDVEWPGALSHAHAGALRDGVPFKVARARKTFFEMVHRRAASRPDAPCWPSAGNRQCTSDLKRDPINREVRRYMKARGLKKVVMCMGIRAEESPGRAKLEPLRFSKRNSLAGREWWEWLPIHALSREQVFAVIEAAGETPHPAYAAGNDRLSCMFCILGSKNDLRNAAIYNPGLYRRYVELEQSSGYAMHQSRKPLIKLTGIECDAAAGQRSVTSAEYGPLSGAEETERRSRALSPLKPGPPRGIPKEGRRHRALARGPHDQAQTRAGATSRRRGCVGRACRNAAAALRGRRGEPFDMADGRIRRETLLVRGVGVGRWQPDPPLQQSRPRWAHGTGQGCYQPGVVLARCQEARADTQRERRRRDGRQPRVRGARLACSRGNTGLAKSGGVTAGRDRHLEGMRRR